MALDVQLNEVLRRVLESRVSDIWTAFPAKVLSYNANAQTADVAPVVQRPVPTGDEGEEVSWEDLPVLPGIRVCFPRGGGDAFTITWPIQAGDWVAVHVATYSFANWLRTGEITNPPGDVRPHSLNNAWAVPCMAPNAASLSQAAVSAMILTATDLRLGDKSASDFVPLASLVMRELNKVRVTLASATAPPGGGTVTYGTPYSPADVAATLVKAK